MNLRTDMSTAYGKNLKLYIDGNSHGPSISMRLEGFPAGLKVDMDELCAFLARRAPGGEVFSTKRKEDDAPEFLSGIENGVTTGGTIHAVIYNKDAHSNGASLLYVCVNHRMAAGVIREMPALVLSIVG